MEYSPKKVSDCFDNFVIIADNTNKKLFIQT